MEGSSAALTSRARAPTRARCTRRSSRAKPRHTPSGPRRARAAVPDAAIHGGGGRNGDRGRGACRLHAATLCPDGERRGRPAHRVRERGRAAARAHDGPASRAGGSTRARQWPRANHSPAGDRERVARGDRDGRGTRSRSARHSRAVELCTSRGGCVARYHARHPDGGIHRRGGDRERDHRGRVARFSFDDVPGRRARCACERERGNASLGAGSSFPDRFTGRALDRALLVVAGLFVRTLDNLRRLDAGFDRKTLVLVTVNRGAVTVPHRAPRSRPRWRPFQASLGDSTQTSGLLVVGRRLRLRRRHEARRPTTSRA